MPPKTVQSPSPKNGKFASLIEGRIRKWSRVFGLVMIHQIVTFNSILFCKMEAKLLSPFFSFLNVAKEGYFVSLWLFRSLFMFSQKKIVWLIKWYHLDF